MFRNVEHAGGLHRPAKGGYGSFGREAGGVLGGQGGFHTADSKQDFLALQALLALPHAIPHEKLARMPAMHELIKCKRERLGLKNPQALADRMNGLGVPGGKVTRQNVELWEKSKEDGGNAPNKMRLRYLGRALGLSVDELLAGEERGDSAGASGLLAPVNGPPPKWKVADASGARSDIEPISPTAAAVQTIAALLGTLTGLQRRLADTALQALIADPSAAGDIAKELERLSAGGAAPATTPDHQREVGGMNRGARIYQWPLKPRTP